MEKVILVKERRPFLARLATRLSNVQDTGRNSWKKYYFFNEIVLGMLEELPSRTIMASRRSMPKRHSSHRTLLLERAGQRPPLMSGPWSDIPEVNQIAEG